LNDITTLITASAVLLLFNDFGRFILLVISGTAGWCSRNP